MFAKKLGVLALVGAAFAVACGGDEPEKFPNAEAYCSARAAEECVVAERCGVTVDACKAKRTPLCTQAATVASGQSRSYTPGPVQGCLDALKALYAKPLFTRAEQKAAEAVCDKIFPGSKAKAAGCADTLECASGLVCDKDKGSVCAEKADRKLDDQCNNAGDVCAANTYCGSRGSLKYCIEAEPEGNLCTDSVPCKDELRCDGFVKPSTSGTCKAKIANGTDACTADGECQSGYCDSATKKCVAGIAFAAGAGSCKDYGG